MKRAALSRLAHLTGAAGWSWVELGGGGKQCHQCRREFHLAEDAGQQVSSEVSEAHGARIPELALDQPHFAERLILLDMHVGVALVGRKIETDLARQQQADRYRSVAGPKNGLTFSVLLRNHRLTA